MRPAVFDRIVKQAPFHDEGYGFDTFGLQPAYLARAIDAARPIYDRYFRVESQGAENIPASGPTIVVANHGGVLPVDAAMLCMDVLLRTEPPRIPRAIGDRFISRLPIVNTLFGRLGVVSGTRNNVRRLLERGELLAIWPEGVMGPGKSFKDRYTISAWSVGFAEMAIRHRASVVAAAIVGSEESWPLLAKFGRIHPFGAPFLPIPVSPVPLPAHYHVRYGTPMSFAHDLDADDPTDVEHAATRVRLALEQLIEQSRMSRRGVFR